MAITVDGVARPDLDQLVTEQERDPISHTVGNPSRETEIYDPITADYSGFDTGTCGKRLVGEYRLGMGVGLVGQGTSGITAQNDLATTGGSGSGLKADIVTVAGGKATSVKIRTLGTGYKRGDLITIAAATHGGVGNVTFRLGAGY